jgi:SAM-dependent methyltransferase
LRRQPKSETMALVGTRIRGMSVYGIIRGAGRSTTMAHQQQIDFCNSVKETFPDLFRECLVLDIGSLDINGNNQYLFEDCLYLGVDLLPGKNVDLASKGHELMLPDESIDVIISTECFEHDQFYALTLKNIVRMLKPGGLFVFTCATTGRPEHGTRRTTPKDSPFTQEFGDWSDYYKNLQEDDIQSVLDMKALFKKYAFSVDSVTHDLYFWGIKKGTLINRHDYSFQIQQSNRRLALKAREAIITELLETIDERSVQIGNLNQVVVQKLMQLLSEVT